MVQREDFCSYTIPFVYRHFPLSDLSGNKPDCL
jgi:hypothetical protein